MKFSRAVIKVRDYRQSFEFYKDVLGLKLTSSWQRKDSWGALFSAGSAIIEIIWYPSGKGLEDCYYIPEKDKIDLNFEVHDIDIVYLRLKEKDVKIVKEPFDASWGYRIFAIKDPDEVSISIMQPI